MNDIKDLDFWKIGVKKDSILNFIKDFQGSIFYSYIPKDNIAGEMEFDTFKEFIKHSETKILFYYVFPLEKSSVCINEEFLSLQQIKDKLGPLFEQYGISIETISRKIPADLNLFYYEIDKKYYSSKEILLLDKIVDFNKKISNEFENNSISNHVNIYLNYNGCIFRTAITDDTILKEYDNKRIEFLEHILLIAINDIQQLTDENESIKDDGWELLKNYLLKDKNFWAHTTQKERRLYFDQKINQISIRPNDDIEFMDILYKSLQGNINISLELARGYQWRISSEIYRFAEQSIKTEFGDFRKMKKCWEDYLGETIACWKDKDKTKYQDTVYCDICEHRKECTFEEKTFIFN